MPESGISGLSRNTTHRLSVIIHLLGPLKGKTPWWGRISGLHYTHTAFEVNGKLWDQTIDDVCRCYNADEWCREKMWTIPRECAAFRVTAWVNGAHVAHEVESLEGRHGQKVRTMLRYFHLWPTITWNCVSSVVVVLRSMGLEISAETPDELYRFLQLSAASIPGMGTSVKQIA